MWDQIEFFSEYFWIRSDESKNDDFFDIVLDSDLPVFVDPFLIFCSEKEEYKKLYQEIIKYLQFLSRKSVYNISKWEFNEYYLFHEVQETHIWYSLEWNNWRWLWVWFWKVLVNNLRKIFTNSDENNHIEKLCLIVDKVWRDKLSDFTINLIKSFLAEYTSNIVKDIEDKMRVEEKLVRRCIFDYNKEVWLDKSYKLPYKDWKYFLLIPKDILTKDDTWMNKKDLTNKFLYELPQKIENEQLRFKVNQIIIDDLNKDEKIKKLKLLIKENPELIQDYIKYKETTWNDSKEFSYKWIISLSSLINKEKINKFSTIINDYSSKDNFNSYEEAKSLILFFKDTIENKKVWEEFWFNWSDRIDEKSVQNLFKLTWRWSKFFITPENNQGTWPTDFTISKWADDVTVIEFKLATNKKAIPIKQLDSYKKANNTKKWIIVVFCFSFDEVEKIEKKVKKEKVENVFIIDVTPKKSASNL